MRRSNWTFDRLPRDDHNVYLAVDDLGRLGRVWREADFEATDFETVVTDLLEGQYKNPIGIFAFNTAGMVTRRFRRRRDRIAPALRSAAARRAGISAGLRRSKRCYRSVPAFAAVALGMTIKCDGCDDCGWVCESHEGAQPTLAARPPGQTHPECRRTSSRGRQGGLAAICEKGPALARGCANELMSYRGSSNSDVRGHLQFLLRGVEQELI